MFPGCVTRPTGITSAPVSQMGPSAENMIPCVLAIPALEGGVLALKWASSKKCDGRVMSTRRHVTTSLSKSLIGVRPVSIIFPYRPAMDMTLSVEVKVQFSLEIFMFGPVQHYF